MGHPTPPWEPLGRVLEAYLDGDHSAVVQVTMEYGARDVLPGSVLFRAQGLPPAEEMALALARGRVLDVGAGAGAHALVLEGRGLEVVALDVAPRAVAVMRRRGVRDPRLGDVFRFSGGPFDTVLLMMNGVGLAGDLEGLDRLLAQLHRLLAPGGVVLLDASDLRVTDEADDLDRLTRRRQEGRYFGEVQYRMAYGDCRGAPFRWLFVDARTLAQHARRGGWRCQLVFEGDDGAYLARLTPAARASTSSAHPQAMVKPEPP